MVTTSGGCSQAASTQVKINNSIMSRHSFFWHFIRTPRQIIVAYINIHIKVYII